MNRFRTITLKTPLLLKVVSLYVIVGVPLYAALAPAVAPPKAYAYAPKVTPLVVAPTKQIVSGNPVEIRIPSLGITLQVIDGRYDIAADAWSLTNDKAQFITTTALPNDNRGNTFIYGHNTVRVFEPTRAITTSDMAYITTDNGHTFQYQYTSDSFVSPSETSVLTTDPPLPTLTIMTCNGMLNETRRLLFFDFKGVS